MIAIENVMTVGTTETTEWMPDEFPFAAFTGSEPACFSRVIEGQPRYVKTMKQADAFDRFLLNYPRGVDAVIRSVAISSFLAGLDATE